MTERLWTSRDLAAYLGYSPKTVARMVSQSPEKLTEKTVKEIRTAEGSIASIARRFGIARAHVRAIKARKLWAHVA